MNKQPTSRNRKPRAFAILMALASTLLVSSIVLVFFNRATSNRTSAFSSGNLMKADALALSGMDVITGEILQEIRRGKTNDQVVGTYPNRTYLPDEDGIVPQTNAQIDRTNTPNLVKVTKVGAPLWQADSGVNGRAIASASSTSSISLNRRSLDPEVWENNGMHSDNNNDQLLNSTTDATPDWVLVTKGNGIKSMSWNKSAMTDKFDPDFVIGRFAATVYDISGLVDLNFAGHTATISADQEAEIVGSLASLDLTKFSPNGSSTTRAFGGVNTIEAFIRLFRNSYSIGQGTDKYIEAITKKASKVGGLYAVEGDNKLLSRKDLLRLSKTPNGDWQSALGATVNNSPVNPDGQYLFTHFSRELNQPSFVYPATASGGAAVRNSTTNPNIHQFRMAQSGMAPDGFEWKAGDPVIPRRFSLNRLDLIKFDSNPSVDSSLESKLLAYFGITRSGNNGPWEYVGSDGTGASTSIKTLSQVAAAGREPNFFEVLKAAIHDDSLGVTSGFENDVDSKGGYVPNAPVIDGISDLQILRIGANIIDQADGDSYPTVIFYDPIPSQEDDPATSYDESAKVKLYAYGIEDLPYIQALGFRTVANLSEVSDTEGLRGRTNANRQVYNQLIPVLWNPHEDIGSDRNGPVPSQLQLYFVGGFRYFLRGKDNDGFHYGADDEVSRFNEAGLGGFTDDGLDRDDNLNDGYILINEVAYNQFRQPEAIKETYGSAARSYSFNDVVLSGVPVTERLPYHGVGILGMTLKNEVIAQGRGLPIGDPDYPRIDTTTSTTDDIEYAWDGYFRYLRTYPKAAPNLPTTELVPVEDPVHHMLNAGTQGRGLNVVLRYRDHRGQWQVYNAFASNVAHPDGLVNTPYDEYAIKADSSGLNGVWMWLNGSRNMPFTLGLDTGHKHRGVVDEVLHNVKRGSSPIANPNAWSGNSGYHRMMTWYGYNHVRDYKAANQYYIMKSDPRTARYGLSASFHGHDLTQLPRDTSKTASFQSNFFGHEMRTRLPNNDNYRVSTETGGNAGGGRYYPGTWAANYDDGRGTQVFDWASGGASGRGIARPGDDYYNRARTLITNADSLYFRQDARPIVLNRPFKNVGELGYVFRDMPFKSLDMFSPHSVDAALLDYFSVSDSDQGMVAGRMNPNSSESNVIELFLAGASRDHDGSKTISNTEAATLAEDFLDADDKPIQNVADIVKRFNAEEGSGGSSSPRITGRVTGAYPAVKKLREAPVRALSQSMNTRTWNLMVDVVAQSGRYTAASDNLDEFLVEGQRRYWMHLAIDRYTGRIIDRQIEIAP